MQLTFDPHISLAVWFPLALATVACLAAYGVLSRGRLPARRRVSVLALMSLAATLPLIVLLNPTWTQQLPPPAGKPQLTILVDTTASMATGDSARPASRFADAVAAARAVEAELGDQFEVRISRFDRLPISTDTGQLGALQQPTGDSTDLAAAIELSLEDRPQGQALLLLSDGAHNTTSGATGVRQAVEKARAMAVPVYTRTFGVETGVSDLEVSLRLPQEMAFVGQRIPVSVFVRQRGQAFSESPLELWLADEKVAEQTVPLASAGVADATFQIEAEQTGLYRYEVRLPADPREATALNNRATLLVRVVDQPVRVLLLEGKPYWDSKFLIRTLSSDRSIELTSVVRMAENRYLRREIARPEQPASPSAEGADAETQAAAAEELRRREEWDVLETADSALPDAAGLRDFQIILLGRDADSMLDESMLARLRQWIAEDEGSLVCYRGVPSTRISQGLEDLLPVRWSPASESRFHMQFTDSGETLRWLPAEGGTQADLTSLPSLAASAVVNRAKPLTVVLATTATTAEQADPVISYQPFGSGRVVVVEGAGMWRWALLPPQRQADNRVYGMLWSSLVRWLAAHIGLLPSQQASLRPDKVSFQIGEPATATLLLREDVQGDAVPAVELSGEAIGTARQIAPLAVGSAPGTFRVPLGELAEGRYQLRVVGMDDAPAASAAFDVHGNWTEQLDVAARPDLMRYIAEQSGGAVLDSSQQVEPEQLADMIGQHFERVQPRRVIRTSLWDRWWVLLGVFAAWGAAWGLRRQTGLV